MLRFTTRLQVSLSKLPMWQSRTSRANSCANQRYDSLQSSLHKRFSMGLEYQLSYTFSKGMSDSIGYYGEGGQAGGQSAYMQNLYDRRSREKLLELQLRRLQATVAWVHDRVPYYREQLDALGVGRRDIRSLDDVRRLPFTDKTALRDTYPFGMFAVDLDHVVRIHSSSGTTGKPIVVGYTKGDLATWTECTARVAAAAGITSTDRVQMAFLYGMFTGGWGMHYGIERIGATVIPAGSGNTERHIMMMQDFGTTAPASRRRSSTQSAGCFVSRQKKSTSTAVYALTCSPGRACFTHRITFR